VPDERADVRSTLVADSRIAGRIITGLGRRPAEVEQRLADNALKPAPQRLAAVLCQLAEAAAETGLLAYRRPEIRLTHEQIADLEDHSAAGPPHAHRL
jgi:CRP/FNR family transcriptional regulator, cyclic AMP receptor protein